MVLKTSGGACIIVSDGNSEKKSEKNIFEDDLAFKKLILENNEVSLSTVLQKKLQGATINKSISVGVSRSSWNISHSVILTHFFIFNRKLKFIILLY